MRRIAAVAALTAGVLVAFPVLASFYLMVRFDEFSGRRHAAVIRKAIPWKVAAYISPLLPLWALVHPDLWVPTEHWGIARFSVVAGWLLIGLSLLEVYSVCLHREAHIARYEPWWLPSSYSPLGGRPRRVADRRLQHLARVQLAYCAPLAVMALWISLQQQPLGGALGFLFLVKYIAPANVDFEAYFHWDMHCRVLDVQDRPRLTSIWRTLADWLMGPMIGSVPRLYRTEHQTIHHVENSGPEDIHSPLPYDRTRLLEFCVFGLKTCAIVMSSWGIASHRRCRGQQRYILLAAVGMYWIAALGLVFADRLLGYWLIFAALYRGINIAMSQYVWHGLGDPENPRHPKASTVLWLPDEHLTAGYDGGLPAASKTEHGVGTLTPGRVGVPVYGTDWAFFDNYHLIHHLHPRSHFTEYPELLARRIPELLDGGSVVMRLAEYDSFVFDCWNGRYERIADALVTPMPTENKVAFIRSRLVPLPGYRSYVAAMSEGRIGDTVESVLVRCVRVLRKSG